ncbi:hypothetical protein [Terrihabitans rhizophilus]|uniref:DUF883 domain-containing protein n=1 Tax=Terrihabitans rhizophilus TaxID=3092662 RepID=A0ABU4RM60_9HYPH|nr:hypothetical protein [Terrihabitans sp. PJ23]MDX6805194.1 hypothetical protein [Terrihabitans sp. PJ23]
MATAPNPTENLNQTPRASGATSTSSAKAAVGNSADDLAVDARIASADLETLRDDVLRLSKAVTALVSAQAQSARVTVTDKANELYDTGLDYVRTAEDQVRSVADDVSVSVRQNPLTAIGITFAVGYILGRIRGR